MGRWDDKFTRWQRKWETWRMKEYPEHERVLTHILEDKARTHENKVVFQFRDYPITFGELNERINKAANGFRKLGIKKGDKVAMMLPNCPEFLYAWFGLNKIGAVEVPINLALKGSGLAYQLTQSDSIALVADTKYMENVRAVEDELKGIRHTVLYGGEGGTMPAPLRRGEQLTFKELLANPATAPKAEIGFKDITTIMYTSGTTGPSKGVLMSNHYWYEVWAECVKYSRYTEDDVLYTGLPFFHGNAQGITVGPAILADAKAVVVERFSASRLWEDIRKYECTEFNYIGGVIPILLKQPARDDDGDNPVRIAVGAAASKEAMIEFERRFKLKMLEVYGMTECYCCLANPYDETRPGSCGKPITGWSVKLVDDDDNEVQPGDLGEFVARPERMWLGTNGYYNKPVETLEFFQNFWMHTGDLGTRDQDGYFYFVDRKKQAIRRRGENISSFEVEAVINSLPAVLESCAVGVPSDVGEEEVKVVIVLKEGQQATPEEIIRWCEPRMAYFAIPRYIAIRPELPKTPSERVEKYKLKKEGITSDCWDREKAGIKLQR
jgi:crotonobetaine/carnitine-CoA ligase